MLAVVDEIGDFDGCCGAGEEAEAEDGDEGGPCALGEGDGPEDGCGEENGECEVGEDVEGYVGVGQGS